MKKSDIGLIAALYAIVLFFFTMTMQYKPGVRIYPFFVMGVLFCLITAHLVICLKDYFKNKKIINDMSEIFSGIVLKQFFTILLLSVIYIVLIGILGFYTATILYLISTFLFLKVPKIHICIATVGFTVMVYGAFTTFLHVPLPKGILF